MIVQSKAFWVGLFVIGGIAVGIIAIVWLGASDWLAKKETFVTYFDGSTQGLNVEAEVKFRGVQVGRVGEIRVAPDGNLIEVTLELDSEFQVADSLRAALRFTGITGLKYIEMDYVGPERLDDYPELSFEPPYPVIPSYRGGLEEVERTLREVFNKIGAIDTEGLSWRAIRFLDAGTHLMTTADSLLRTLEAQQYGTRIDSMLVDFQEGADRFNRLLAGLDREMSTLQLGQRADSLMLRAEGLLRSSQELVEGTRYPTVNLVTSLTKTLAALNVTLEELNALIISLESNPSRVIYGAPPPEER